MTRRTAAILFSLLVGGGLSACGDDSDGNGEAGPAPTGASHAVVVRNTAFAPVSLSVKAGDTVTWTFEDAIEHTATADAGDFDSGKKSGGATFEHAFDEAGTFAYHCEIHTFMKATVTVS